MGWQPDYATEGAIYAKPCSAAYKDNLKDLRIGMLYQNGPSSGKDYTGGFLTGLGKQKEHLVTAKGSYEGPIQPVDWRSSVIKNSGAKVS